MERTDRDEARDKQWNETMAQAQAQAQAGGALYAEQAKRHFGSRADCGELVRPGLRERVNSSFYHAERETRNVCRLKELADLLDTNPAIARILELIETTGV